MTEKLENISNPGAVLIIIPAYNEESSIGDVLDAVGKNLTADVLVIDDGSTDDTRGIARGKNAVVLSLPYNAGYGVALETGFKYALEEGYEFILQMDADGQHDAGFANELLKEVTEDRADIVFGSRYMGKGNYKTCLPKKVGMALFGVIASAIVGKRITDPTSGFQSFNKRVLEFYAANHYPDDYPDADMLVLLHYAGFRTKEMPVIMHKSNKKSMHSGFRPFYYVFKMLFSIFLILISDKRLLSNRI
jgi:glycosyltransferase involved in cell wall biosynthesis